MDAERSERKPAGAGIPSSANEIRRINAEESQAKTISFDEMWTYLGVRRGKKRRSVWIWTAVVEERDGRRWSDFEVGRRDAATFLRLLRRLPKAAKYRSDRYEAYSVLPLILHVKGKGSEVNRNEGLHSKLRVRLNRLVRRTHGYSKRLYMLVGSLAMVWSGTVYINASAFNEYRRFGIRRRASA